MTENTKPSRKRIVLRCIIVAVIVLIILAVLFLGYVAILQPILGNPFNPSQEYKGLEYFEPAVYQEFEKGNLFVEQYEAYEFLNACEVIDFYYRDTKGSDNFLRGKRSDVYGLTLDAGTHYNDIEEYIRSNGTPCGKNFSGYETYSYYLLPSSGLESDRFVCCVGDEREFLRFILVTEIEDEDLVIGTGSGDIISMQIIMESIIHNSSLAFKEGNVS